MRNLFISAFTLFLLFDLTPQASEAAIHPFYVSIISIDHNSGSSSLELTFKIFTDDLEKGVEDETATKLRLATSEQSSKADEEIASYLKKHFELKLDGKIFTAGYLGFEPEYDVTRIYMECENIPAFTEIEVTTDLLVKVLPEQSNIVHVNYRGETKSLMLNAGERKGKLIF